MKRITVLVVILILLSACAPSQANNSSVPTNTVGEIVQATMQALTAQAPAETLIPAAEDPIVAPTMASEPTSIAAPFPNQTGSIAGVLEEGYTHVVAFTPDASRYYAADIDTTAGGSAHVFRIDNVPAGVYHVLAFTNAGKFSAPFPSAYSKYVECGMLKACMNHNLIDVVVNPGRVTDGVYVLDTWGMPDFQPYSDKFNNEIYNFDAPPAAGFPKEMGGTIWGELDYGSGGLPAMFVVAYRLDGAPDEYYFSVSKADIPTYGIANIPAGKYYVMAYTLGGDLGNGSFYPKFAGAAFTQYVVCGMFPTCTDHSLVVVNIAPGDSVPAHPQDWKPNPGDLRPFPLP